MNVRPERLSSHSKSLRVPTLRGFWTTQIQNRNVEASDDMKELMIYQRKGSKVMLVKHEQERSYYLQWWSQHGESPSESEFVINDIRIQVSAKNCKHHTEK